MGETAPGPDSREVAGFSSLSGWLRRGRQGLNGWPAWRRYALAFGLGLLATGALPPAYLIFLLIPSFTGLYWLMDAAPGPRSALATGWWFGFGYFAAGFYWITFALLVYPDRFGWLAPVAVIGLAAPFALYPALVVWLARKVPGGGPGRVLMFAVLWTLAEWLRAWVFTGFPWNLAGSVWAGSEAVMQAAALTGIYGLSLLTVTAAALPAVLAEDGRGRGWKALAVVYGVLALVWFGGSLRLNGAVDSFVPDVRLRLVQANIPQRLKWQRPLRQSHIQKHMSLSAGRHADTPPPTHIIWGETAAPLFLANDPARLGQVASVVPPGGLLITGAPRTTPRREQTFRVWNSLHAVNDSGRVIATYDKFHLVPFGEYMPLKKLLKLDKITAGGTDFSAGPGLRTLRLPGLPPVGPLICYEVIFPGAVLDRRDRPHWLLNLTNDAWYGRTAGPYQHLAAARFRAVEEGLAVVRVANTGISAVIDAYGRPVARLGLGQQGAIDSRLPTALASPPLYARLGNWLTAWLLLSAAVCGWLLAVRRP